jgi:hypothetical protein
LLNHKNEDDNPSEATIFLKSFRGGKADKSIIPILRRKLPKKKPTPVQENPFEDVATERNTAASSLTGTRAKIDFTRSTMSKQNTDSRMVSSSNIAQNSEVNGAFMLSRYLTK